MSTLADKDDMMVDREGHTWPVQTLLKADERHLLAARGQHLKLCYACAEGWNCRGHRYCTANKAETLYGQLYYNTCACPNVDCMAAGLKHADREINRLVGRRVQRLVATQQLAFLVGFRRANRRSPFENLACHPDLLGMVLSFTGLDHQPHEPVEFHMDHQPSTGHNVYPVKWIDYTSQRYQCICVVCDPFDTFYNSENCENGFHYLGVRYSSIVTVILHARRCTLHPAHRLGHSRLSRLYDTRYVRCLITPVRTGVKAKRHRRMVVVEEKKQPDLSLTPQDYTLAWAKEHGTCFRCAEQVGRSHNTCCDIASSCGCTDEVCLSQPFNYQSYAPMHASGTRRLHRLLAIQVMTYMTSFRRANRGHPFEVVACDGGLMRTVLSFTGLDHVAHEPYVDDDVWSMVPHLLHTRLVRATRHQRWQRSGVASEIIKFIGTKDMLVGDSEGWQRESEMSRWNWSNATTADVMDGVFEEKRTGCFYCSPYLAQQSSRTEFNHVYVNVILAHVKKSSLHPSQQASSARLSRMYDLRFIQRMIQPAPLVSRRRRRYTGKRILRPVSDSDSDDEMVDAPPPQQPRSAAAMLVEHEIARGGSSRDMVD
jgi:hypothetical protein